jgi:calcineurin-like phosphoesterase family protein
MNTQKKMFSSMFAAATAISILIVVILLITENTTEKYPAYGSSNSSSLNRSASTNINTNNTLSIPVDFNFAAAGDWGCTSNTNMTVNNMLDKKPELVLGLGDYSYNSKYANCWLKIVKPIEDKMKITIGNHDDKTLPSLRQYMSHFNLTNQYYSFNYQNVHFTVMSTEVPYGAASAQYEFVNSDLANASSDPNIDWIIVYYHRLAYTSPTHHRAIPLLQNTYHPLFEKYEVDLVLQGHNHNYQRSYPINYNPAIFLSKSTTKTTSPTITDTNITDYNNPKGQIFAIVGTGGQYDNSYKLKAKAPYIVTQHVEHGILNIDVINNGKMLTAKFYENGSGIVKDQFTITNDRTNS